MEATKLLKEAYWSSFAQVYSHYSPIDKPIQSKHFGEVVTDFLKSSTPLDRDYSMKNIFRLDLEAQGLIHFD